MKSLIITLIITFNSIILFAQEKKYQLGDFAQGGIIFWLDETGKHGLVCSKKDLDRIHSNFPLLRTACTGV